MLRNLLSRVINRSNQDKRFETFNGNKYQETAHLQRASFGVRKINIFHHLIEVGDTLYDQNEKEFGFIQGFSILTAVIMSPDIETLFKSPTGASVPVPTITQILSTATVEQADYLQYSQTVTYKPRNFIPITLFLIKPINDSVSKSYVDSRVVLVECVKAVKDFDTKHANNAEYVDKSKYKCKEIMFWLYFVSHNNNEIDAV